MPSHKESGSARPRVPKKPATSPRAADSHSGVLPIELLLRSLPAEFVQQAVQIAITKMRLTPEKLALILIRHVNPAEHIEQGEEVTLRNVDRHALTKRKNEGHYPYFINGLRTLAES